MGRVGAVFEREEMSFLVVLACFDVRVRFAGAGRETVGAITVALRVLAILLRRVERAVRYVFWTAMVSAAPASAKLMFSAAIKFLLNTDSFFSTRGMRGSALPELSVCDRTDSINAGVCAEFLPK